MQLNLSMTSMAYSYSRLSASLRSSYHFYFWSYLYWLYEKNCTLPRKHGWLNDCHYFWVERKDGSGGIHRPESWFLSLSAWGILTCCRGPLPLVCKMMSRVVQGVDVIKRSTGVSATLDLRSWPCRYLWGSQMWLAELWCSQDYWRLIPAPILLVVLLAWQEGSRSFGAEVFRSFIVSMDLAFGRLFVRVRFRIFETTIGSEQLSSWLLN